MNIGELKSNVAAYFEKPASYFVIGGTDLLLVAMNSSRKKAELVHDFEASKVSVDLVVDDVNGGDVSAAVLTGTETVVRVKSVISAGCVLDERFRPMGFSTTTSIDKWRLAHERDGWWDGQLRYPSDADYCMDSWTGRGRRSKVLQFGNRIFKYPFGNTGETSTLRMQVYKWFDEYTDNTNSDLFTQHGYDYMKWSSIVEVNHLAKSFVARQEGNLAPPTGLADAALQMLIGWDEYIVEGART